MDAGALWAFLPIGYALGTLIETPVLVVGLSRRHSLATRLFAGFWLTACTYPIVVLVFPWIASPIDSRWTYLLLAETFAPFAECVLFHVAWGRRNAGSRSGVLQDSAVIVAANLSSFGVGEWIGS